MREALLAGSPFPPGCRDSPRQPEHPARRQSAGSSGGKSRRNLPSSLHLGVDDLYAAFQPQPLVALAYKRQALTTATAGTEAEHRNCQGNCRWEEQS